MPFCKPVKFLGHERAEKGVASEEGETQALLRVKTEVFFREDSQIL